MQVAKQLPHFYKSLHGTGQEVIILDFPMSGFVVQSGAKSNFSFGFGLDFTLIVLDLFRFVTNLIAPKSCLELVGQGESRVQS